IRRDVGWWAAQAGKSHTQVEAEMRPLDEFRFLHLVMWSPPFLEALLGPLSQWGAGEIDRYIATNPFFSRYCRLIAYLRHEPQDTLSDRRVGKIFKALLAACLYHGFQPWESPTYQANVEAIDAAFRSVVPHLWEHPRDEVFQATLKWVAQRLGPSPA